jgi:hypothetical protein
VLYSAKEYKAQKDIQPRKKVLKTLAYSQIICHISKTLNAECLSLVKSKSKRDSHLARPLAVHYANYGIIGQLTQHSFRASVVTGLCV